MDRIDQSRELFIRFFIAAAPESSGTITLDIRLNTVWDMIAGSSEELLIVI